MVAILQHISAVNALILELKLFRIIPPVANGDALAAYGELLMLLAKPG